MAASCENCGGIVTRDLEEVVLSVDRWYAHRTGICRDCGKTVKWHRPIAGRLGAGYLYLSYIPGRRGPARRDALTTTNLPGCPLKSRARNRLRGTFAGSAWCSRLLLSFLVGLEVIQTQQLMTFESSGIRSRRGARNQRKAATSPRVPPTLAPSF
jgi:hypothetical protein